jgi:tRNA-dihydrouridine synthase A
MVTTGAILHGDRDHLLGYDPAEHPIALQLGGSEPKALAQCADIAQAWGYDEVNLNVGCPSDRVQSGRFGACLMAEPHLVADCVAAMRAAVSIPVTVKTRIGIDEQDSYDELVRFVELITAAGCQTIIIHARKAWLTGLSPRENRDIPPLRYDIVHRIKADFPGLNIVINGGLTDLEQVADHLTDLDGAMIGRAAYQNPYLLAEVDNRFFAEQKPPSSRHQIIEQWLAYWEQLQDVHLMAGARHLLGLFQGQPGARAWRRYLSENAHRRGAGPEVIREALRRMQDSAQRVVAVD